MTTPLPGNTSGTARLIGAAPSYAVGWQQPVYLKNPAAGAVWSRKTDGRYYERLVAATFTINTDAVAGSRYPEMVLEDNNGNTVLASPIYNGLAASSQILVSMILNGAGFGTITANGAFGFLPDVLVPPDWSWNFAMAGMDVGDFITGIVLLVQQFPNDAAVINAGE